MKRKSPALTALCGLLASVISLHGQSYRLTDLSLAADQSATVPMAVNRAGEVTGTSGDAAFRYASGMKENLGTLSGGRFSRGFAINTLGDVAGDSTFSDRSVVTHATLFIKGEAIDLGTLPRVGAYSIARGVNDSREVVGYAGAEAPSEMTRAFIWNETTGMQRLPVLGSGYSQALAISNTHLVTGNAQFTAGSTARHAFLWSAAGGMRDLGTLGGGSSYGTFVNDNGHVVGYSEVNTRTAEEKPIHAFFYDGTKMRDLKMTSLTADSNDHSAALGINIRDEIVGVTYLDATNKSAQTAFLYRNGVMFDLNRLVDNSGALYDLQSANAINDRGQIVALAIHRRTGGLRAVLLTPTTIR